MPKDFFVFKQFAIYQPYDDVMKVSTDSVLLGCFADVEKFENGKALDIGCGTGLLSLMMAQKNPTIEITCIDINPNACKNTKYNIQRSSFKNKFSIVLISLKNFLDISKNLYDVIICNPPYFSNSLKSNWSEKNLYRHQGELTYDVLIESVKKLLSPDGSFYVSIPYYEHQSFLRKIESASLFVHRTMQIFANHKKQHPYLFLFEIKKEIPTKEQKNTLIIQNNNGYTEEYLSYTQNFYIFAN